MTLMCDSWETLQGEIRCNPFGGQQLRTFLNNNPKINNITSTSLAFTLIKILTIQWQAETNPVYQGQAEPEGQCK